MSKAILVIDPEAEYFRGKLNAAFPSLEVRTAVARDEIGDELAEIDALGAMPRVFSDDLIRKAKRLKWIQVFTTGTDAVTRLPSLRSEVVVTSTRGIHGPQMAEMAFLHMIALSRDYPRMLRNQDKAAWDRFPQRRLYGKTVAILGVGTGGKDLAVRCKAFGMTVVGITNTLRKLPAFDRMVLRSQIEEAVSQADYFAVLVPYSKDTDKIVNARVLAAMKPTAYLINIARGGVCDEDALVAALREKRIAGAGLDVFRTEPLPPDNPLWRMEHVLVTPHLAGQCDVYNELVASVLESNVKCFLEDRWKDMVNLVAH